jgi:hypothetical protein
MVTVNMCRKKTTVFISFVLLSVTVSAVSEGTCWWKGGGGGIDKYWTNPDNWWGGTPTSASTASLNDGRGVQCEIDGSTTAQCSELRIGDFANTVDICYLYMTGGTCTVGTEFSIGHTEFDQAQHLKSTSVFEMSGGTVTVGTKLSVSGDGGGYTVHGGNATFNMTGGTVTAAGTLYISEAGGLGVLNLNGGTIEANDLVMNPAETNGLIDIGGGTLILNGDKTAKVNGYVDGPNNWIIAYGGAPEYVVEAKYDIGTGKTTVKAVAPSLASAPFPEDNAIRVDCNVILNWSPGDYAADVNGHDIYLGTNFNGVNNATVTTPLGVYMGRHDTNSYDTNGLEQGLIYYWRIDEVNTGQPGSPWKGPVWSFTTLAEFDPDSNLVSLWEFEEGSGTNANDSAGTNHGTIYGNPNWVTGKVGFYALDFDGTNDYVNVGTMGNFGSSLKNNGGVVSISSWVKSSVTNSQMSTFGITNSGVSTSLGIALNADYLGTYKGHIYVFVRDDNGSTLAAAVRSDTGITNGNWYHLAAVVKKSLGIAEVYVDGVKQTVSYDPGSRNGTNFSNFQYGMTIGAENNRGSIVQYVTGQIDDVRIYNKALSAGEIIEVYQDGLRGIRAFSPSPDNEETDVELNTVLSWSSGKGAVWHDVYLGTNFNDVNIAADPNTSPGRGRQDANSYDPCGLELGKNYYWRIDEVDGTGSAVKGDIWRFEVTESILIDDFESYADGNGLRLVWIDGNDGNNNTGSNIYLGTNMCHNSAKSMECDYSNNSTPYCSEVYRTYGTAVDWTAGKFLVIFFHGDVDNDPERMYVVLEDDNDVNAVLTYAGDANDLIQEEAEYWNVWNIKLQDFNDGGVDLSRIKKITIGFGGSGGAGTVYFDDIRLSSSRCAADYDYLPGSDFNRDTAVNFLDYVKLANAWLTSSAESGFDELYDLDSSDVINTGDLGNFSDDWLWPEKQVQITVDACDIKGDISTMLTGVNMNFDDDTDEIWADGSIAGYLIDVKAGILRYPGGAKTGYYHWQYPYVPKYIDAWSPLEDPNDYISNTSHMDVDEYIASCRIIGAEPLLGINIESGKRETRIADSIAEAADLVTYCNVTNDYNVVYWYLDNEPYYVGMDVVEYTGYVKQFGAAMRAVDANIKLVVNWENKLGVESYWSDWEYLIEEANEYVDVADLHWYWAWEYCTWDLWLSDNPMIVREWCGDCPGSRYYGPSYVEEIRQFHEKIKDVNGVSYDIKLAALEWNLGNSGSFTFSRFQNALIHAEMLGQYIAGGLDMATMWPLSWAGDIGSNFRAIIDQENHRPTPSFYVFKLYSNALGQQLITSQTSQVYIRPVSALSQDGNTLWVFLLNKSADGQAVRAILDINGFSMVGAEAIALTTADLSSDVAGLQKIVIGPSGNGQWECVLPPYSLTMLTFHKNN